MRILTYCLSLNLFLIVIISKISSNLTVKITVYKTERILFLRGGKKSSTLLDKYSLFFL